LGSKRRLTLLATDPAGLATVVGMNIVKDVILSITIAMAAMVSAKIVRVAWYIVRGFVAGPVNAVSEPSG
jgi:hypothetical protein